MKRLHRFLTITKHRISCTLIIILFLLASINSYGAGTEVADFLNVGVGARPVAMGQAFTAVADDINSLFWNPAGLGLIKGHEVTFTYNDAFAAPAYGLDGIKQGYVAYAGEFESIGTLGIGINYLSAGTLIGRNIAGHLTSDFTAYDLAISLAYANTLIENMLFFGVNVKFISEVIESESASAFALDFGAIYKPFTFPLTFGLVFQNIGTKMKFVSEEEPLPFTYKLGVSYKMFDNDLILAVDLNKPTKDPFYINVGGEYCFMDLVSARIGYSLDTKLENNVGLSLGGGVKYQGFILDYAYMPFVDLGNTHKISLSIEF